MLKVSNIKGGDRWCCVWKDRENRGWMGRGTVLKLSCNIIIEWAYNIKFSVRGYGCYWGGGGGGGGARKGSFVREYEEEAREVERVWSEKQTRQGTCGDIYYLIRWWLCGGCEGGGDTVGWCGGALTPLPSRIYLSVSSLGSPTVRGPSVWVHLWVL